MYMQHVYSAINQEPIMSMYIYINGDAWGILSSDSLICKS